MVWERKFWLWERKFWLWAVIAFQGILTFVLYWQFYGHSNIVEKLYSFDTIHDDNLKVVGDDEDINENYDNYKQQNWTSDIATFDKNNKIVIFPENYQNLDLDAEYIKFHDASSLDNVIITRFQSNQHDEYQIFKQANQFSLFEMDVFAANINIDNDMSNCSLLNHKVDIEIGKPISMAISLKDLLVDFVSQQPEYYQEITGFFNEDNNLDKLIKENRINDHWFRLAGTSVYLKQYGVHYMVSRILFSPSGARDKPAFSLLIANIYDKNWQHIPNVELIVPSNNPDFNQDKSNTFKSIKYPSVLPIPFYHNSKHTHDRFYGPEDPRIILIQNSNGFEEPLIIFNQEHRKINKYIQENESDVSIKFDRFRSMFIGWPWQFQYGKKIAEVVSSKSEWENRLYMRIIELKRKDINRKAEEKNWTPLLSYEDQKLYNHDKYLYLVYKWSNLEVLKCPISDIDDILISNCEYEYRMKSDSNEGGVGAFRGGTEMININSLLYQSSVKSPFAEKILKSLSNKQEIWLGFARAHLKCACSKSMYRPNLAIITKIDGKFKISHASSFLSFDIPMIKWSLNSKSLCDDDGASALIPNGISDWVIDDENDYLTLSYSVSDSTVDIIHIKGLLTSLSNLGGDSNDVSTSPFVSSMLSVEAGFNDENINCAIEESKVFCENYKIMIDEQEKTVN